MNKTWKPRILVGTSGYGYDHWRGLFYPEKLASLASNLKEVYIYFNNDAEAFAVENAKSIRGYLQTSKV